MDHLPDELIRAIFCETITLPRAALNPDRVYSLEANATLAAQPYLLAAVSHRWREVSLDTAELWTYIPLLWRPDPLPLTFIAQNLARSSNQPLIIVLKPLICCDPLFSSALQLFVEHARRWLRVHIRLDKTSHGLINAQFMQACASCAMPVLEELIIDTGEPSHLITVFEPNKLLYCPSLVRLTNHVGILTPTTTLGALRYLSLSIRNTNEAPLWRALEMAPSLESLEVYFALDGNEQVSLAPEHDIYLPLLTSFALIGEPPMDAPWFGRLHIPNLMALTLSIDSCHRLGMLYQTLRSRNLHLTLMPDCCGSSGTLFAADAVELKILRGVSTLEIFGFREKLSDDDFFWTLETYAQEDASCWAAKFTPLVLRDCSFDTEAIKQIAQFVRMRASITATESTAPRLDVYWIACLHDEDDVEPKWLSDQWI